MPRESEKEREVRVFSFSISPFKPHEKEADEDEEEQEELLEHEVRVKAPEEVPWTDLLLEISMTTAFASLTDGTPILQVTDALSYISYFAFVWWIWVSQVAYNMRFRQADILHRIWMFLQLAAFSALAAFTKDFDITDGLVSNSSQTQANQLISQLEDASYADAIKFREGRLPLLNAQGVSMVMALSRLLLLAQYLVVFFHARHLKRKSLLAHILPLGFSAFCYLIAFLSLGLAPDQSTKLVSVIKLVLWFFPIIVEVASHFVAFHLAHFVRYSATSIYDRIGTVFLIILGAGLDKITGGFKSIVGNGGLGFSGIPLFFSASIIFIGFFSLFFATPNPTKKLGRKPLLAWFFTKFFFFSALIITLQGIANSLQFSNINASINHGHAGLVPLFEALEANPNVALQASNFTYSDNQFRRLGVSLEQIVVYLNGAAASDQGGNGSLHRAELQVEAFVIYDILTNLDAAPDTDSLLGLQLLQFINVDLSNATVLSDVNFWGIKESIIRQQATNSLWFYPSAGATILSLSSWTFIMGIPRDKWEWRIIYCRFIVGIFTSLLGFMDIGSSKPIFDQNGRMTDSIIWRIILDDRQPLLIIMAIIMAILLIVEFLMAYLAQRPYMSFGGLRLMGGMPEAPEVGMYQKAKTSDGDDSTFATSRYGHDSQVTLPRDKYYDPYRMPVPSVPE